MTFGADDFVLPIDKPEGPTSHDVVAAARRALRTRRIGHTGTLDPFASGLLLLCVGRATRLAEYLSGLDKSYEAVARLGIETDTLDREGEVLARDDGWRDLDEARVRAAVERFAGPIDQVPPQFSAKKVRGEAMHRKARRGEAVELEPVRVVVHEIGVTAAALPDVHLSVRCSSGTYIRALARDLGRALHVGGHLVALRRTAIGRFDVRAAVALDELDQPERVRAAAIDPAGAVAHLGTVTVDGAAVRRLSHGQRIRLSERDLPGSADPADSTGTPSTAAGLPVAVLQGDELVAIGEVDDGLLRPKKVFAR